MPKRIIGTLPDLTGETNKVLGVTSETLDWVDPPSGAAGFTTMKHRAGQLGISPKYLAGVAVARDVGAVSSAPADVIRALPIFCPSWGATITELMVNINSSAASRNVRFAIYRNKAEDDLYPGDLAEESSSLDASSPGQLSAVVSVVCSPGELVWICYLPNNTSISIPCISTSSFGLPIVGFTDISSAPTWGHLIPYSFGAYPDPMPTAGRTDYNSTLISVFVTFS